MNSWRTPDDQTYEFLRAFGDSDELADEQAGSQFADPFVVADPQRSLTVTREAFVASLPLRRQLFARAGVGSPQLVEAHQLDLDDLHLLVRTTWRAPRAERPDVLLESTFLVRRSTPPHILVYLNHNDLTEMLAR